MSGRAVGPGASIGHAIQVLRERAGIGQRDLARRMGMSTTWMCHLEQGKIADPGIGTVMAAADVLGVTVGELIGEKPSFNLRSAEVEVQLRRALRRIGREALAAANGAPDA